MKTTLTAIALAATLAQPASAITFPSLTTIYVGTGVLDSGGADNTGTATTFFCSNVSGITAQVRFLILSDIGAFVVSSTPSRMAALSSFPRGPRFLLKPPPKHHQSQYSCGEYRIHSVWRLLPSCGRECSRSTRR
jgi:hypothetical protein